MDNPLFAPSPLPYGLPPFADIEPEHYLPAFERGFAEQREELERIASDPEAPGFENTIAAWERSGRLLERVSRVFGNLSSSHATGQIDEIDERVAPLEAEHRDAILLDARLYARVRQLHDDIDALGLDEEQRYLLQRRYRNMTLAGAGLDAATTERLRAINSRLSELTTRFKRNLLDDGNDLAVHVASAEELDGLSPGELSAARSAAQERGLEGYLVTLVLYTGHPWLASLRSPTTRERVMAASRARGSRDTAHDNRPVLLEIVRLRAERARLLGFDTHAGTVTADETAGTPEAVAGLLERLAPAAARNAAREHAELEALAGAPVTAADWAYYADRVRAERFAVDTSAMRDYFEADRVLRDGVFFAATGLYGIRFTERHDLVGYHPDVRVFEVTEDDGTPVGLYLLDLYARPTKRGGAWMNSLIQQNALLDHPTVVVNNLNVPKPAEGEPTLLTLDELTTLFHEFGHALHGLFARATYPSLGGTNVYRDFVEFPSQVNEMWALWPEVLANYAVHHVTGEPMPTELAEKVSAARSYGEGFATSEYLAAALLDQAWHGITADDPVDDVEEFERNALARVGLDHPAVPPRYSSTYFAHVFSGGYDAGYYSYIWSEVLDADTVEWFRESGGLTRENGERFRRLLLQTAGTREPLDAYREFRGRDAEIAPLLRRRGLD
ncbi:peptidyl-dipeptidase Dcp [Diaminobutyricimonas aerilata]|uniref:Peptidyl-dipeptidase Dcp n=1 Tax=Diaminobutyricimonas aerilata TaxID=1162967 RepID=A0A2M9CJ79_9MICO|nr:M3 family metallopeptidase [Diaminobutyricimonas aerilata]PJJ71950.1 peptidyl-dipeptidase Dcp [Diaminobutyricimonas aerilata]